MPAARNPMTLRDARRRGVMTFTAEAKVLI
jgi:hypothetical protein